MAKITINQTTVEWDTERGTCTFNGIPAVSMWVNSTYHHIMSSIVDMVGEERFLLSQQKQGRESIDDDWVSISQHKDFAEGIREHSRLAAVGGWGVMSLVELDHTGKQAIFRIHDGVEGRSQKEGNVCWGSGVIAGKLAGFCERLFDTHCWPEQTKFIAKGDACDEFLITKSDITVERELDRLIHTDQATKTDMVAALEQLENEIVHRLQAQKALQKSEARLAEAQQVAHVGHWVHDILNDKTLWSDETYRIYGYEPQSLIPDTNFFQSIAHPDDLERVMTTFENALKGPSSVEFRIIRPDGTQRVITATAHVAETDKGKPVQLFGIIQDITERKERDLEIQKSEARLAEAQQIAHVGHWIHDIHKDETFFSDETYRIYGFAPQSFTPNKSFFRTIVHPDDVKQVMGTFDNAVKEPSSVEFRCIRPDGTQRIISATANLMEVDHEGKPTHLFGILQDITEQKEREQEITNSEARLTEAQQVAHVGSWEYDPANKVVHWSDELFRIVGHEPQSFVPSMRSFGKIIHPDDLRHASLGAKSTLNTPEKSQFRIIRPDGTHRVIATTVWNTDDHNDQPRRIFGIVQDITERIALEKTNRDQELNLIQADKMTSLGLLVSGVAHEINNPNNLIQINASLLQEMWRDVKPVLEKFRAENSSFLIGGLPYDDAIDSIPGMIRGLTDASRRIENNINDLKNFARRGDQQNLVEISVNEAVESAVRLLQSMIKSKTDYLQLNLADDLPNIESNLQHVEQIVINLLSNALDALPDKKHKVWISSFFDNETRHIRIEIKDNGTGIPKPDLKKIFDPFFTTKQEVGGTGLGLAIANNLTKEHGGHLSCFSVKNEGTIFTVSFPIK